MYKLNGQNRKKDFTLELFENRGMDMYTVHEYMRTSDEVINPYTDLENMDKAVASVYSHIEKGSNILLVVDPDVDGYTSSAIIYNALTATFPNIHLDFINQSGKQHGLSAFDESDFEGYNLVIVPDAGTNDYASHEILASHGIELVILDHHEADGYSKDAIVVNSQLSENYENKMFSGAGIAWQFIRCMSDTYNLDIDCDHYLDLVGLGNVSDMMSLQSFETKHLINKGFKKINNPFFKALVAKQDYSMKSKVTPMTVGWYIGPLINAVVRVGTPEEKELMFNAFLEKNKDVLLPSTKRGAKEGDTELLTEHMARISANIRNRQGKLVDSGMEIINKKIADEKLTDNKALIVEIDDGVIPPELIGLVANKIASGRQQPTAIVRQIGDDLVGSIRNFDNSPVEDFKGELINTGLINWSMGHAGAAGLSFPKVNKAELNKALNERWKEFDMSPKYHVDFVFDAKDREDMQRLTECVLELGKLNEEGLWGQDLAEPTIAIENLSVGQNVVKMGSKSVTMKITTPNLSFIKFGSSDAEIESLTSKFGSHSLTVIGTPNLNVWRGQASGQVMIKDYKVNDTQKYSF